MDKRTRKPKGRIPKKEYMDKEECIRRAIWETSIKFNESTYTNLCTFIFSSRIDDEDIVNYMQSMKSMEDLEEYRKQHFEELGKPDPLSIDVPLYVGLKILIDNNKILFDILPQFQLTDYEVDGPIEISDMLTRVSYDYIGAIHAPDESTEPVEKVKPTKYSKKTHDVQRKRERDTKYINFSYS
jgi:hypothetical protein